MNKFKSKAKQTLAVLLSLALMLSLAVLPAAADYLGPIYNDKSGDYRYTVLDDGTAKIISYYGSDTDLIIPSEIDGYKVASIDYQAMSFIESLISVTIPDSVTNIGENAFSYCSNLKSITIPDSVTRIGSGAFGGSAWYDQQPNGVIYLGRVAQGYKGEMPKNTEIVLKNGTSGISDYAFYQYTNLSSINIPNSVKSIGVSAFKVDLSIFV